MNLLQGLFDSKKGMEFEISLKDEEERAIYRLELLNNEKFMFPIYGAKENITGTVNIHIPGRTRLEHTGIMIQLVGVIVNFANGGEVHEFLQEEKQLEKAGTLMGRKSFKFSFKKVSKEFESYYGINVRVRYCLRVVATRPYRPNLIEEKEIWVIKKGKEPQNSKKINMDVGVEGHLQIQFNFDKDTYHLHDVITGNIHFILARIPIRHMDIELVRKEIVGSGDKEVLESEVLAKYEIMDGLPVKDEVIPVRMYLRPYDLSPSFHNIDKLFSLKYFINLVIVDAEEKRFFKQHEIVLWRDIDVLE